MNPGTREPENPRTLEPANLLALLHLCDSLFPIGSFAHSDGLETAALQMRTPDDLRGWLDVCVEETFARFEGPAVARAWTAFRDASWDGLVALDREVTALRPSAAARRASCAMGLRLVTTWHVLHPNDGLTRLLTEAASGCLGPTLPIAFAAACASCGIDRRATIHGYAYTRLAAVASAAMRVMPIGQTDAHRRLAGALQRLPPLVDAIDRSAAPLECFSPFMDIAAMTQQYLDSRLFRS